MLTPIATYQPQWLKIGDLIEEYLEGFLKYSPYFLAILSVSIIFVHLSFLMFFTASYYIIYFYIKFNMSQKIDLPQMGQITLAKEEMKKTNKKRETIYYFSKLGTIVKDFRATSTEQARKIDLKPENIKYEYLVDKSKFTMHMILAGTTGAGKTVTLMSTVIHPCIVSGSSFIYIEGKGDRPISEDVYSLFVEHGREDDVFFLDFGAVSSGGYSHSIAPLAIGSAVVLNEALTNLIDIMTGENSWVSDMATEFMLAILFPLVVFRDLDLMISTKDIKAVKNLKDFKDIQRVNFNLTLLRNYLNYQSAIDLVYAFRELLDDKEFIKILREHPNHKSIGNYEESYLFPLASFLENRSVDISNRLEIPNYMEVTKPDTQKQNNYAVNPWSKALNTFGNEAVYGRIFNREYPDIDFLQAMKSGKSIIASLPSMQNSADKNEKIGRMLTSLIKGALGAMLSEGEMQGTMAEKDAQKRVRPYKVPYMLIFDEISNFGNDMMGQMASMIRSIGTEGGGIGMVISGQSISDIEKIGEGGHPGEQLKDNMGIALFHNISGKGYPEMASQYCGKKWEYELKKDAVLHSGDSKNSQISQSLERKEVDFYPTNYFITKLQKQSGEGIIVQNAFAFPEKIVTTFVEPKPIHNDGKKSGVYLVKNISHEKIMTIFSNQKKEKVYEKIEPDLLPEDEKIELEKEKRIFKEENQKMAS